MLRETSSSNIDLVKIGNLASRLETLLIPSYAQWDNKDYKKRRWNLRSIIKLSRDLELDIEEVGLTNLFPYLSLDLLAAFHDPQNRTLWKEALRAYELKAQRPATFQECQERGIDLENCPYVSCELNSWAYTALRNRNAGRKKNTKNRKVPVRDRVAKCLWPFTQYEYTLEEVGKLFLVTRERIRQIEAKALDKLWRRGLFLENFLEEDPNMQFTRSSGRPSNHGGNE